jgi:hypothetical protein
MPSRYEEPVRATAFLKVRIKFSLRRESAARRQEQMAIAPSTDKPNTCALKLTSIYRYATFRIRKGTTSKGVAFRYRPSPVVHQRPLQLPPSVGLLGRFGRGHREVLFTLSPKQINRKYDELRTGGNPQSGGLAAEDYPEEAERLQTNKDHSRPADTSQH